jgi:hypothetical protein
MQAGTPIKMAAGVYRLLNRLLEEGGGLFPANVNPQPDSIVIFLLGGDKGAKKPGG